jgi:hypothetical protein
MMPLREAETLLADYDDTELLEIRDKINLKNGNGRKKVTTTNNASTSSTIETNRLCYCTDGIEACGRDNDTCVKHTNAACFHSMQEVCFIKKHDLSDKTTNVSTN